MSPASGKVIPQEVGARTLPGALLTGGYILLVVAGVYGFFRPPVSAVHTVAGFSLASVLWNVGLVAAGIVGVYSRVARMPRTEIIAVEVAATVLSAWAAFVFAAPSVSDQSGYALLGIAVLMYGWAAGTRRYLGARSELLDNNGGERKDE